MRYEYAAGPAGKSPAEWPAESRLRLDSTRHTLVLVAHPQCPCTRASLGELAILSAQFPDRFSTYVLFLHPDGKNLEWVQSGLWDEARRIPGVIAVDDVQGREAARFGATTSGQTFLFDAEGHLVFRGGITAARGHSGDNAGRSAIASYLTDGTADRNTTFVFGCLLFSKKTT